MPHQVDAGLATTLKKVAAALKAADIPFALGGSFAVYAHGGHSSDHDVDFLLREQDKDQALADFKASDYRLMLFGLVLVVMMLVRPEGLVPSARRKAELQADAETAEQQNTDLFDVEQKNAQLSME